VQDLLTRAEPSRLPNGNIYAKGPKMTLSHALLPAQSRFAQVLMVLAGSVFIAIAAQISVPMFPVPMTLQTLAILMDGMTMGARLGAATLIVYLAEGAMGLPVFANGAAGLPYMMGPTGGFLIGFVMMAWLAGLVAQSGIARKFSPTALCMIAISALLYLPGLAWPAAFMGKSADVLWTHWMSPFLIGDATKAVLAALVVFGGWAAVKARKAK